MMNQNKELSFSRRLCPNYSEAGDLASLVTLVMYAVSPQPLATVAVMVMMTASIYNTLEMALETVPVKARKSPTLGKVIEPNPLNQTSLINDLSHPSKKKDQPRKDKNNIFRL